VDPAAAIALRPARWPEDRAALEFVRRRVFVEEQGVPESEEWDAEDARSWHVLAVAGIREPVGTGFCKIGNILFRFNNHQVHIEWLGGVFFHSRNNGHTEGNVWNKSTIHHITMNPVCFALIQHIECFSNATEVRRKHRWCYQRFHKWVKIQQDKRIRAA
jgi:hypothetical protein